MAASGQCHEDGRHEPSVGGKGMAVVGDAVVDPDQAHQRGDVAAAALVGETGGDVDLPIARAGGEAGHLHCLGGIEPQSPVPLDLGREQGDAQLGQLGWCRRKAHPAEVGDGARGVAQPLDDLALAVGVVPRPLHRGERRALQLLVEEPAQVEVGRQHIGVLAGDEDRCRPRVLAEGDVVVASRSDPREPTLRGDQDGVEVAVIEPAPQRVELGAHLVRPVHLPASCHPLHRLAERPPHPEAAR